MHKKTHAVSTEGSLTLKYILFSRQASLKRQAFLVEDHSKFSIHLSYSFEGYIKIKEYRRIKETLFSTHLTSFPLVKKISTHVNHENLSEKWNIGANFEDF